METYFWLDSLGFSFECFLNYAINFYDGTVLFFLYTIQEGL